MILKIIDIINKKILQKIDKVFYKDLDVAYSPIFIIGAPRSGTTLFYQVLCNYYKIGYLSNMGCLFYGCPVIVEKLIKLLKLNIKIDYKSKYGKTKKLFAPSECGRFWYRFFKKDKVYLQDSSGVDIKYLRKSVNTLLYINGGKFVFKNLNNCLRLLQLNKAFPNAVYLVVKRNTSDNAYSILKARQELYGDINSWFSVKPLEYDVLSKLSPEKQVIGQINSTYNLIEKHKNIIGKRKFITLNYEDFCNDSEAEMKKIDMFLRKNKIELSRSASIPKMFQKRNIHKGVDLLYKKIKKAKNCKGE